MATATIQLIDWDLLLETVQQVKEGTRVPGYLLGVGADTKTVKGEKYGYLTGIQYLTPADGSGIANLCPFASAGCKASCLNTRVVPAIIASTALSIKNWRKCVR